MTVVDDYHFDPPYDLLVHPFDSSFINVPRAWALQVPALSQPWTDGLFACHSVNRRSTHSFLHSGP